MTIQTQSQQCAQLIAHWTAEANRLLAVMQHDSIKSELRLALRDLEEGRHYLESTNIDSRPATLMIVDLTINLATGRLVAVQSAFATYGPDAMLIG